WLNGECVIDFDYADKKWADEVGLLRKRGGKLADRGANLHLQDHGDPVWYRGIKMRAIPKEEELKRYEVTPTEIPDEARKKEKAYLEALEKREKEKKDKK